MSGRLGLLLTQPSRVVTSALVLLILPCVIAAIYISLPPMNGLLTQDSPEYMYFSINRPVGYPTVLYIVKQLTGNYENIIYVQIVIFFIAAYLAAFSLSCFLEQLLAPLIFEIGTLVYPGPILSAYQIMSESLSTSAFLLLIAALFYFGRSPSFGRYALVCVVFAAAMTLRPVNVYMALPALLLPLFFRHERELGAARCIGTALLSAAIGWGVTPATNVLLHGSASTSSPLPDALFSKSIYLDPPNKPFPKQCDSEFIEEITDPVVRYVKAVPSEFRGLLRLRYRNYLTYGGVIPRLVKLHKFESEAQTHHILMCYALARYRQSPGAALKQLALDYWNLISNYTFIDRKTHRNYLEYIDSHPPVLVLTFAHPPSEYELRHAAIAELKTARNVLDADSIHSFLGMTGTNFTPPLARPLVLIITLKIAQVTAVIFSIFLVILLVPTVLGNIRDRGLILLGLISVAIQAALLTTAFVEMAIPRYIYPMWPGLWLILTWSLSEIARNAFGNHAWSRARIDPNVI